MTQPDLFGGPSVALSSDDGEAVDASGRRVLDAYYTPDPLAAVLVPRLGLDAGTLVLEPSVGGGAFLRALTAAGCVVEARDIDPNAWGVQPGRAAVASVGDFLGWAPSTAPRWVVGNPPYCDAEAHVRHALEVASVGVAMLLRLAFLESDQRLPFWRSHPASHVDVLAQRPSFTGGGSDPAAYGWFVWRKRQRRMCTLSVLGW